MESVRARIRSFLDRLVTAGAASAAVAGRVGEGEPEVLGAAAIPGLAAAPSDIRFDLASLTKPFTATLALLLDAAGELLLDCELGELWPETAPALAHCRLEDLLRHRSGLAPWIPLYQLVNGRGEARAEILRGRWLHGEAEGRAVYSDLGYILWGFAAERRTGRSLAELMEQHVTVPWGLKTIRPLDAHFQQNVLLSPMDTAKEVELAEGLGLRVPLQASPLEVVQEGVGEGLVQDGNARFLAGRSDGGALGALSGHAGLFGSLGDVLTFGQAWLRAALGEPSAPMPRELVRRALSEPGAGKPTGWALGWARQDDAGSSGPGLSSKAFGHPGFSGTSLWIDPERREAYALLATRNSPQEDFNRWRREFHQLVG
ncbi:MAG: serine hydrolase domain-containing protein [Acidobacteriota bacterium]|nr:serine hydrolase domain-containing protein [Acidobacteriota bacterium]